MPLRSFMPGSFTSIGCVIGLLVLLSACREETQKAEEIRPVRSVVVQSAAVAASASYSGDVHARYESKLGFRVAGKLFARLVDVGARVSKGQVLARVDATDLELNATAAQAALTSAESDLQQAQSEFERFRQMHEKHLVSDIEFSNRENRYNIAKSRFDQAQAQARMGQNQARYADLTADATGVVTELFAEVGQIVNAGQPVVSIARDGEREIQISVPESRVDEIKSIQDIKVSLWAQPGVEYAGAVREIAPDADPVTRTYGVRISVLNASASLRLGMTASVALTSAATNAVRLPLSAIYQTGDTPQVWIIQADGRVALKPVKVGRYADNDVLVLSGLMDGERVITAGVNRLVNGQKVRVLEN